MRPGGRPASASTFVYLASQSPRRRELLAQIGVRHEPLLAGADEDVEALEAERAGELPDAYVERVTRAKLVAARERSLPVVLVDRPPLPEGVTAVSSVDEVLEALEGR